MKKIFRYLKYFDYYLETFAKNIGGRGNMDPHTNGEYSILENIIKLNSLNQGDNLCFVDGGSNIGNHIKFFSDTAKKHDIKNYQIFAIEPFPPTLEILRKNIKDIDCKILNEALGDEEGAVSFYSENEDNVSGQNSVIPHYYLNHKIEVKQNTLDNIFQSNNIKHIDFLKLDIEGYEYKALLGAKSILSNQSIDYIQLEYNQTWIEGRGSIEKILKICNLNGYKLYKIRNKDLISIPEYNFILDDFFYCNLLLVKNGCSLPLPHSRQALPFI